MSKTDAHTNDPAGKCRSRRWLGMASAGMAIVAVTGACSSSSKSSSGSSPTSSGSATTSGAGSAGSSAGAGKTIKVGFIDSLTGPLSFVGVEQQQAFNLAVKAINAKSGVHIDVVTKDDQSTAAGGVSAMEQLLSDPSVQAIVGEDSTEVGDATLPLLAKDGRPAIFLQITELPNRPSNVFSLAPPTNGVAKKVADYVFNGSVKSVGLISQVQPTLSAAISTFQQEAAAKGVSVVSNQQTPLTTTSFNSQITNVLSAKPDAIGISGVGPASGSIIAGLRSAGFKGTIFAQQAADSAATVKTAGASVEGTLVGSYWDPALADSSPVSKDFVSAFQAAYPSQPKPDVNAMEGYDALNIFAQVFNSGALTKSAIVSALSSGSFQAGLQSPLSFSSSGFANISGYVVQLHSSGTNTIVK